MAIGWSAADVCHCMFGDALPKETGDSLFLLHNASRSNTRIDVLKSEGWYVLLSEYDLKPLISKLGLWGDEKASQMIKDGKGALNADGQQVTSYICIDGDERKEIYLFRQEEDYFACLDAIEVAT